MSFTHASYALRIGVSISHTFQHRRYISIARTGNVIMYALGLFFAETIPLSAHNTPLSNVRMTEHACSILYI